MALVGYGISSGLLITGLRSNALKKPTILSFGCLATLCHGFVAWNHLYSDFGIQLGVVSFACLFTWVIAFMGTSISLVRKNVPILAPTYPVAFLGILITFMATDNIAPKAHLSPGILLHVITSLIAYSILTLAVSQAVLLSIQNYQLKHHHIHDVLKVLPPLQTMEIIMFDMVWAGFALLTVSVASGFLFVDDLFAQHLAHKTALTVLAWVIMGILLFGRYTRGWRGMRAVYWVLVSFCLLILGYFGSKVVIELILERS